MIRTLSISRNRNKVIKKIEKKIERDRKEIEKEKKNMLGGNRVCSISNFARKRKIL